MGSGASPRAFVRTLSAFSTFTTIVGPFESPILATESRQRRWSEAAGDRCALNFRIHGATTRAH